MICLFGLVATVAADEAPPETGRIAFLAVARAVRRRAEPVTAHHAEILLRTAGYLAEELAAEELPGSLRAQLLLKIGELIATAWTPRPPGGDAELPAGVRRLALEARGAEPLTRAAAEAALRPVLEVLGEHARAPSFAAGAGFAERAVETLARVDHPWAVSELLAISRDAPDEAARRRAASRLGEFAARRDLARYAEICARLLLE